MEIDEELDSAVFHNYAPTGRRSRLAKSLETCLQSQFV